MLVLGLISADAFFCHAVAEQIKEREAWQLAVFSSLAEALQSWRTSLPSVLFWDVGSAYKETDCASLTARLREEKPLPFILLLDSAEKKNAEAFPDANERFSRPLRLGYFMARLQFYEKLLRQSPETICFLKGFRFSLKERLLQPREGGEALRLTDKEAALLGCLCAASGFVSRETLLEDVWGYDARIDTHTLETHIYRLRRKILGEAPEESDPFLTEEGGYALNPDWRQK